MNRKAILAALAVAATAGGTVLLSGPEADEAAEAVDAGVPPADVRTEERWEASSTVVDGKFVVTRVLKLVALDDDGTVVGSLSVAREPDVTPYDPCYIVASIARCERERGDACPARAAWASAVAALETAGVTMPDPAACADL